MRDLNRRVRHAMKEASEQGKTRVDAELRGFAAYFRFTAEHTALYRIIRQAEFVSPEMLRYHYERLAEGFGRSGSKMEDVGILCALHMKRSMHEALLETLGVPPERTVNLDDTGHRSGVDPLLALDRAARSGLLAAGEIVLLLAAGTGYTWAASVLRWGDV